MRVGILTGGGDAPGLNGIIESLVKVLTNAKLEVVGIQDGFEGVFQERTRLLTADSVFGAHVLAGSLLGASNKSRIKGREQEFVSKFKKLKLDGLIAIGGDGTFSALSNVKDEVKMIGLPKTIDNDLAGTDFTFGFDTACSVVAEAIQSLRATAETHNRIFVVETMGRTSGWIALGGGLASYADAILIPERPYDKAALLSYTNKAKQKGRRGFLIAVSEGAAAIGEDPAVQMRVQGSPQPERYGGVSFALSRWLEEQTGWESRNIILGHLQRSRHPTTTDNLLTLSMGVEAARMVLESDWQRAVVYRKGEVVRAPIQDLMQPARLISPDHRWVQLAQALGLFV